MCLKEKRGYYLSSIMAVDISECFMASSPELLEEVWKPCRLFLSCLNEIRSGWTNEMSQGGHLEN